MKKLYTLAALLFVFTLSNAQISKGKDFWFGFLQNYYPQSGEMRVYITSETPCSGMISSPLQAWSQTFTVTPGVSTLVLVPYNIGENLDNDIINTKALHVTTTECVSVFAHYYQTATSDAAVIFPTNSVGNDYLVTTWFNANMNNGSPEFLIAATEDGTNIDITPTTAAGSHAAGVTYSISIDSGEVYQLQSTNGDLTGTRVRGTNNKNFALFGGHVCANIIGCGYCDHLFDQLYPTPSWGTDFVTVPYVGRDYDVFRVLASQNGTQFRINGGAPINLNAGQFNEFTRSAVSEITSNLPVTVMQYSTGTDCDANLDDIGDPFMIALSPVNQSINTVTFNAFANASATFTYYANIVAKTADLSTVTFDGVGIGASFLPVPQNPAYSYTQRTITQGDHSISANQGIITYVYGYGSYESYGYSAGVRVQVPILSVYDTSKAYCPFDTVRLSLNTPDTARLVSLEWDLGDGSPHLFDTLSFWHIYNNYGEYPITIIYELQAACKKDTLIIDTVKILGPEPDFGGPFQFCSPQSINLQVTSRVTPDTLFWQVGNNSFFTTDPNYVLNLFADKDTTVYVRVSSAICDGFDTARIYVASDSAGFTVNNACSGTPVNFSNTSRYVNGLLYNWHWDFGDGSTSISLSPNHLYSTGGTYQVKLVLTSPAGCSDSITQPVTIYAKPNVDIVVNQVCNDSVYTPINNSTISSGIMSFDWNFGDGTAHDTAQYPSHEYAQSGAYNITLVASSGGGACKDSVTLPQNIIIGAVQEFSGVKVCMGQTTQFTDLTVNSSGSAILSYNWDFGDANTSTQQSPSHTYSAEGSYQVTLMLDYGSNCYDSIKRNVTVNPIPVADFTVADLCNTGTAAPINTSTISVGNMNMSWSFGDITATVVGQNPPHTYALSGNYNIQLIAVSDSACADTVIQPIIVNRGTTIDFTALAVCEGNTTSFTDQTTNPFNTTINSYTWDFGDANSSTQQNTAHTYTTFGTYNVELKLDYGNNCADSLTKVVTVNEIPVATFTIADVCNDSIATPVNNSTISAGAMNYNWLFGDATAAVTGLNPSHTYYQSNTYTIQLITSVASGCADTVTAPVIMTIGTRIDFTAPAVCEGSTTTFNNQTTNPYSTNINSYAWDFGDANSSTQQNTTHTYATFGTYNVELKLDYGNNCADSLTNVVTVYEIPVATFAIADVCNDSIATPVNNSTISAGAMNHSWLFGDGSIATTGLNPSHTYQQSNTYTIQLVTSTIAGCADTTANPVNIIVGTTINFNTNDLCEGATSVFNNQTINPYNTTITDYTWSFGDGNSSTQQNTTHIYSLAGNYNVQLKLDYGNTCADSLTKPVVVNANPAADFNSSIPCIGNNMQLTDASTPAPSINSWAWDLGDGTTINTQNGTHNYSTSGNYNVQLITTTNVGCKDTVQKQVTILGKGNAQFTAPNVCNPNATPFTNTTDVATYPANSFDWNFGDGTGTITQTDPSYIYAAAGVYQVTIIANFSNGCADTSTRAIEVYIIPSVTDVIQDVSCGGGNDGSIQLTPNIGQQPFTYVWNNLLTASGITSLTIGNYTVTFTDSHTCTASAAYVVSEPAPLLVDTTVTPITCFGYSDGAIVVTATNGTPSYFYIWNNGNTTNAVSQLSAGAYSVTVSDSKNCSVTATLVLNNPAPYTILLDTVAAVNLGETVLLSADAINGNPVTWLWSPDNYLSCATCKQTEAGPYYNYVYNVQSVDDKGCVANATVLVNVVPKYEVFVPNVFTPNNDGANDYFEVFGNKQAWKQFEVQVFNRIGEKVYESNDMNFKWDGTYKDTLLNPTVLVYLVKVIYLNNYSEKIFKGSLTLIR